jgi:hypothetical protein
MTHDILSKIPHIRATVPCIQARSWAVWQRRLIETMSEAVYPYLQKYTRPDGTLIWRDNQDDSYQTRDGADDFYESFYNFALLYLLGGSDDLLHLAHHHWEGVTRQLTELGLVQDEYEKGYDQFHQGESYIYFYFLCLADPTNPKLIDRARRFANLYLNENPNALNYDPQHKLIRAPHNGSMGARWGYADGEPYYGWYPYMAMYGLPYEDVDGIDSYDDLKNEDLARRMGVVMEERMGKGDVVTNLMVTSLVTNAYLLTGDDKYRAWVLEYVSAWQQRAEAHNGLVPDNVGLSGVVGEYMNGKWYGGLYGWAWPHGYYNVGMATLVGGTNAYLISQDPHFLAFPRTLIHTIHGLGEVLTLQALADKFGSFWRVMLDEYPADTPFFVVPYRHQDSGWFDYQTPTLVYPLALWNMTFSAQDWQTVQTLRQHDHADWRKVGAFRTKEDNGHEKAWLCFLQGENSHYPEQILSESYGQVARRLQMIRQDTHDLLNVSIHHWQELNPVITEALVQLTLGAPQIIYNGGLLHCQVRYFDADKQRVGLPDDVSALVEKIETDFIVICLVNVSVFEAHTVIVQAGAFGEHRFNHVSHEVRLSDFPGKQGASGYYTPPLRTETQHQTLNHHLLQIELPPAHEIRLSLGISRHVNQPSYGLPWGNA